MKNKLHKVDNKFEFKIKRNFKLITPCCNKSNKDGKFVNYKHLPAVYGYCHSCNTTSLPPALYKDEKGNEYVWSDAKNKFEPIVSHMYYNNVTQTYHNDVIQCNTEHEKPKKSIKYIPKEQLWWFYKHKPENNLLLYLRNTYGSEKVDSIKELYYIGTNKDGGTVFWQINKDFKIQKAKVMYYNTNGKRKGKIKSPYLNEQGYYACLFGEHLIEKDENKDKPIILVESEKTAIVAAFHLPEYIWLSYGGLSGLTREKTKVLIGRKVLLVPDMSENAVSIMNKKTLLLIDQGIDAHIWDMTKGKSDTQLKNESWYNCDLEDVLRELVKN